jgi:hypothetical protein
MMDSKTSKTAQMVGILVPHGRGESEEFQPMLRRAALIAF